MKTNADTPNENEETGDNEDKEIKTPTGTVPDPIGSSSALLRLQNLGREIRDHYLRNRQGDDMYNRKMAAIQKMTESLRSSFDRPFVLLPFESTVNGLGSDRSDLDLCLVLLERHPDGRETVVESNEIALDALEKSTRALSNLRGIRSIKLIRAKIPIVRFEYKAGWFSRNIEVDLNCGQLNGVRNSHLLHHYARIDDRFPALALVIKRWAKRSSINDASKGTLSSYALNLMAIHYLQYGVTITHHDQSSIQPNLQALLPAIFHAASDVRQLQFFVDLPLGSPSSNQMGLGDLLLGFFEYFSTKFEFETQAISIRSASVISKDQFHSNTSRLIRVEEPFRKKKNTWRLFDPSEKRTRNYTRK